MSSGRIPRRTHHAESFDKRANVVVANGTPLSLRIRRGSPYSWNSRVKMGLASSARAAAAEGPDAPRERQRLERDGRCSQRESCFGVTNNGFKRNKVLVKDIESWP